MPIVQTGRGLLAMPCVPVPATDSGSCSGRMSCGHHSPSRPSSGGPCAPAWHPPPCRRATRPPPMTAAPPRRRLCRVPTRLARSGRCRPGASQAPRPHCLRVRGRWPGCNAAGRWVSTRAEPRWAVSISSGERAQAQAACEQATRLLQASLGCVPAGQLWQVPARGLTHP